VKGQLAWNVFWLRLAASTIAIVVLAGEVRAQNDDFDALRRSLINELPETTVPSAQQLRHIAIDPQIRAYVTDLADAAFKVREEATQHLLDAATDKMQVYALLAGDDLSTEQRYRLLAIVREHLIKTPRGAIGISMSSFPINAGGQIEIRVTDLLPGLPAERVLQIGDRIIQVDGMPLMQGDDLQFRVQSKRPGEKVKLTVKRTEVDEEGQVVMDVDNQVRFKTMELELELGSAELLKNVRGQFNQGSRVESTRLMEAAEASRKYAPQPKPVEVRGGPEALLSATARPGAGAAGSAEDGAFGMAGVDLDRYPSLRRLMLDRRRIARGEMIETRLLRESWTRQLMLMMDTLQQADLPNDQRASLKRAIELYVELMGE
jgi:hypothetical protein